jgi:hypothetical protein
MLTIQKLKDMEPGTIIAQGTCMDNEYGINATRSGRLLRWVAVRGGIHDWTIYYHWASESLEFVKAHGDKLFNLDTIRRLVPCDDEAFEIYRM